MGEVRTILLVATAGYAVSTVVPALWHGVMGLFYSWLAVNELLRTGASGASEAVAVLALMGIFGAMKLVAAALLLGSGAYAGWACLRAVRDDAAPLGRAALVGGGVAVLVEGGGVLSCDCLGTMAGSMTLLLGGVAAFVALQHAREVRDAALVDRA